MNLSCFRQGGFGLFTWQKHTKNNKLLEEIGFFAFKKTGKEHQTFLSSFPSNRTENIFWFVFKFNFLFASEGKEVNPHIFDVMSPWIKERWCFCVCVTLIGYKHAFTSCFHRQDAVLATDHNAVHCTITIFWYLSPHISRRAERHWD